MPTKDESQKILKEAEAVFGEFLGYVSKKASQSKRLSPGELELVSRTTRMVRLIRKQLEEDENIKSWSELEKLTGKKVKSVAHYECDEYGDLGYAQLITFIDGTHKLSCERGNSKDCKVSCGFTLF